MHLNVRFALVSLLALLMAGCSFNNNEDLIGYINEVKMRKGGHIPPLPEFKTYETFIYSSEELRDPFVTSAEEAQITDAVIGGTMAPNPTRHRETLETYPLDSLKFVGHLEQDGQRWAIVTSPDNMVHRISIGNYIGQNYGKIVDISESRVELVEIVNDGRGGWVERDASLALSE